MDYLLLKAWFRALRKQKSDTNKNSINNHKAKNDL